MILNYPVTLSDWRSTTASSETPPLFMTVGQSVCLTDWLTQGLTIWPNDSFIDFPTGKMTSQLICCSKHFLLYWKYILNFTGVNQMLKESSDWTVLLPVSASEWLALTSLLNRWELPPCYRPNSCQWRTNGFPSIWSVCRWWRYFGSRGRAEYSELLCESLLSHERSMRLRCMMLTYCLVHACLKSHREYVSSETYRWTRYQKLVKHLCCQ